MPHLYDYYITIGNQMQAVLKIFLQNLLWKFVENVEKRRAAQSVIFSLRAADCRKLFDFFEIVSG